MYTMCLCLCVSVKSAGAAALPCVANTRVCDSASGSVLTHKPRSPRLQTPPRCPQHDAAV